LLFYGTFSTNTLYHAIEVGNVSYRAGGEHKYHAIKRKNTINQHNHKLSSAWDSRRWSPHHGKASSEGLSSQSLGKYWQLN